MPDKDDNSSSEDDQRPSISSVAVVEDAVEKALQKAEAEKELALHSRKRKKDKAKAMAAGAAGNIFGDDDTGFF